MTTFLNLKSKTDSFLLFTAPLMRFIFLKESQKYEKSHFRTHHFELYRGENVFLLDLFCYKNWFQHRQLWRRIPQCANDRGTILISFFLQVNLFSYPSLSSFGEGSQKAFEGEKLWAASNPGRESAADCSDRQPERNCFLPQCDEEGVQSETRFGTEIDARLINWSALFCFLSK